MGILLRELSALYGAFARGDADPLPALGVQYADYSVWQRRWIEGEDFAAEQGTVLEEGARGDSGVAGVARPDRLAAAARLCTAPLIAVGTRRNVDGEAERALSRRHDTTLFMTVIGGPGVRWSCIVFAFKTIFVIGVAGGNRGSYVKPSKS